VTEIQEDAQGSDEDLDLADVRRITDAATPGPWVDVSRDPKRSGDAGAEVAIEGPGGVVLGTTEWNDEGTLLILRAEDAAFIALARRAVPALLGKVAELEECLGVWDALKASALGLLEAWRESAEKSLRHGDHVLARSTAVLERTTATMRVMDLCVAARRELVLTEWGGTCDGNCPSCGGLLFHFMTRSPGHRPGCTRDAVLTAMGLPDKASRDAERAAVAASKGVKP
jgi:hypothetical protein